MILAIALYAGDVWSRTCRAPVHHILKHHIIVGTAIESARWWRAPVSRPACARRAARIFSKVFPRQESSEMRLRFLEVDPSVLASVLGRTLPCARRGGRWQSKVGGRTVREGDLGWHVVLR